MKEKDNKNKSRSHNNKRKTKKPGGPSLKPLREQFVTKLAAKIAAGLENYSEEDVARFLRSYWFKLEMELDRYGETDLLGIGKLKVEEGLPDGKFRWHPYSPEERRMQKLLGLQQQYGGQQGNIGQPFASPNMTITVDTDGWQIDTILELLSEHRGIPVSDLRKQMNEQLDAAVRELVETGEVGVLPDFGTVRFRGSLKKVVFDISEEVYEAITGGKRNRGQSGS